ncbi:MAG: hypothetical protein LPJ98_04680 [Cyclobacteriaceae bacterium]|nr:hypothetical protein [Cyclobacteriaceae bacterium]
MLQIKIFLNILLNRFPEDCVNEARFIINNGVWVFPYPFIYNYINRKVSVFYEEGFPFVFFEGKKMFFKKGWGKEKVEIYFNDISCEQDVESPHKYCTDTFQPSNNSILLDIGSAEGNFALEYVEKVKKVYVFERDQEWVHALNMTFSKFLNKVNIVQKNIGCEDSGSTISLDSFPVLYNEELFIKVDADGAELEVLKGMDVILRRGTNIKIAICTYHRQYDYMILDNFLRSYNFRTDFSKNKMLFYFDKRIKFPYFRNGVLRATKCADFET